MSEDRQDDRKQQQRRAKARFRARNRDPRNPRVPYPTELDAIGLDYLQAMTGLSDDEINDRYKVGEALSRAWAEAAQNFFDKK
jgi:hypothetical protein